MRFILFGLLFLANPLFAENTLVFKKELLSNINWFPYSMILVVLFAAVLFLAKNSKRLIRPNPDCQVIEKIMLRHKTNIYIIDYQGQRFLIAENQNALAINPLQGLTKAAEGNLQCDAS